MTPNQVTLTRVAAAFAAVALFTFFGNSLVADGAAVALTIAAIALDGVDGYLARTRGLATPLGAQLDIFGDRVVENLFFTLFAVSGLISLWVPVLFFVRGTLTDFLRTLAARAGRSGFGSNSMLESWWGRSLVASRVSRGAYAVLKCVCFCYLGFMLPLAHLTAVWLDAPLRRGLAIASHAIVAATAAFCIIRAVPVIWEGRRYLATPAPQPQAVKRRVPAAALEVPR
jgi:CDP-diacylglycerol--glycerol-3-phosphate 3-phosphatidyltransferase